MKNIEISNIFRNIGALLQIRGDASFRIRSYEKAADIIEGLTVDASELIETGKFQSYPGIGKTIEEKTKEILETGTCQAYEKLIAKMGLEVLDLLGIQGIGGKTASRLYNELDIKNLNQLAEALENGTLQGMKGFGKKTLDTISESLEFLTTYRGTRLISQTMNLAGKLSDIFESCDKLTRYEFSGDLRRREEVCRSLEVVAECAKDIGTTQDALIEHLSQHQEHLTTQIVDAQGTPNGLSLLQSLERIHLLINNDFPGTIYLCSSAEYEATLFLTTATDEHLTALPTGTPLKISDPSKASDFWQETHNNTETEIYEKLGMSYVPPELRQYSDSVALAVEDKLPMLVEFDDMRGDLHTHTDWSDGAHTMNDMVAAAINRGFEYYAITDHSVSSSVANGLDQERLLAQIKHVRELDAATEGITILAGSEVDIRRDGTLDFPDEILAQLDVVVASVHSHFTLSEAEMTKRMIRAIENPYIKIIGHPTGRLLGRRPMYPINLDEVIHAAAENDTILEINGSPSRLDLGPEYVRKAKEAGVLIAINTDAHSVPEFERYQYGVNVARRSGLTKDDVINTYPLEKLRNTLS
ncbi:MAG: DNA polymerase/3'-5' exonuclease PolX [Candidatus Poribacteria bacterium]|nr:DNA polymerase/3'-5' exonuclease PolX [Candidatus Poribacteria bacterium]